jgi:hypothetical protein
MGNRGSFPGGKAAGAWSWPFTCIWSYTSTPNMLSWHGVLLKHGDNFAFTIIKLVNYMIKWHFLHILSFTAPTRLSWAHKQATWFIWNDADGITIGEISPVMENVPHMKYRDIKNGTWIIFKIKQKFIPLI